MYAYESNVNIWARQTFVRVSGFGWINPKIRIVKYTWTHFPQASVIVSNNYAALALKLVLQVSLIAY